MNVCALALTLCVVNGILFFARLRNRMSNRANQIFTSGTLNARTSSTVRRNKRVPFFIDMLVIVFYRETVSINQKVTVISVGFDKEIENALHTKSNIYLGIHIHV